MFVSVDNFKSIEHVANVDLSNLTVLAGINSSGKSSLIQAILLLKQTLEGPSNELLNLKGPYVYANSLIELIHDKKPGEMKFVIRLTKEELKDTEIDRQKGAFALEGLEIEVIFNVKTDQFYVSKFYIKPLFPDGLTPDSDILNNFELERNRLGNYTITYAEKTTKGLKLDEYSFVNFFPVFFANKQKEYISYPITKIARETLKDIFLKVNYIAPLRVKPVLARSYPLEVETRFVVPDGENTRFILDRLATENKEELSLIKEWICGKFNLAQDLNIVKESGKRYRVVITTEKGIKVDLMHMGFGLSQIIPIITQGCISKAGSLLIVEDPDVHMHPSIQAAMADFFIFLCKERGVSSLVETHSDHFITRLRRRIAEEEISTDKVHIIFVSNKYGESIYKNISLSPRGKIEGSMPPGFMDTQDLDFRALINANK